MLDCVPLDLLVFIFASFVVVAGVGGSTFGSIASAIWLHAVTPAQSAALIVSHYRAGPRAYLGLTLLPSVIMSRN